MTLRKPTARDIRQEVRRLRRDSRDYPLLSDVIAEQSDWISLLRESLLATPSVSGEGPAVPVFRVMISPHICVNESDPLTRFLVRLRRRYSSVQVDLVLSPRPEGTVPPSDVRFRIDEPPEKAPEGLHVLPLDGFDSGWPALWFVDSDDALSPEDLEDYLDRRYGWVMLKNATADVERLTRVLGRRPRIHTFVEDYFQVAALVCAGVGATLGPDRYLSGRGLTSANLTSEPNSRPAPLALMWSLPPSGLFPWEREFVRHFAGDRWHDFILDKIPASTDGSIKWTTELSATHTRRRTPGMR